MISALTRSLIVAAGILMAVSLTASSLQAATFKVNSAGDQLDVSIGDKVCAAASGKCTLRAAIQEANARFGPDTIELGSRIHQIEITGSGEDQAASGDLDITDDLTIAGRGRSRTIIHSEVNDRLFEVFDDVQVRFTGLTIQGGKERYGGGISSRGGMVTLVRCAVKNNIATGNSPGGGGIHNTLNGSLKIKGSTVTGNLTKSNTNRVFGGGIWNNGGKLKIIGSRITGNTALSISTAIGGGLAVTQTDQALIKRSTVSDNLAKGASTLGGGLHASVSTVTLRKSKFLRNRVYADNLTASGGGISNLSSLRAVNCRISDNLLVGESLAYGGGLHNVEMFAETQLFNCKITGNRVHAFDARGGGIGNLNILKLGSSTVADNLAYGENEGLGGGVFSQNILTVEDFSRIVGNTASADYGGIYAVGTFNLSKDCTVKDNIPNDIN